MILKQDWTASNVGKRAALANAAKGLSPFAMVDLTEDVAFMHQEADDMRKASAVSATEIRAARAKLAASVPKDADRFMLMLKRFRNLLFALFTSQCPLFIQIYDIIKAFREYSASARANISTESRASILRIILLDQARRFTQGKMTGNTGSLGEFNNMVYQIQAKNCGTYPMWKSLRI